jgi:hypothetical protein
MLAMGFASDFDGLNRFDDFIGHMPAATIVLTGFVIGAATSWLGWQAGKRSTVPIGTAAAPA